MHQRIDQALALVEVAFRESTIADLLNDPERPRPLCDRGEPMRSTSTR
jgi:hypothetical protein